MSLNPTDDTISSNPVHDSSATTTTHNAYKEAVIKSGVVSQFYKSRDKSLSIVSVEIAESQRPRYQSLSISIKQPEELSLCSFTADTQLLIPVENNRTGSLKGLGLLKYSKMLMEKKLAEFRREDSPGCKPLLLLKCVQKHKLELIVLWSFFLGCILGFLSYHLLLSN